MGLISSLLPPLITRVCIPVMLGIVVENDVENIALIYNQ